MHDDRLHSRTAELRLLMHLLWKLSSQMLDTWLAENETGITRLQLGVLRMIDHEGPRTISDLSRHIGIDPSTLVPTVDALERKALLSRGRDPNDRRRVPLSLTPEGKTLLDSIPLVREGDPLVEGIKGFQDEKIVEVIKVLLTIVKQQPDGPQMLSDALPRLLAYGAKEEYLVCKQLETT